MNGWSGAEDAYGSEIEAVFAGNATHEIVERDDGYIDAYLGTYLFRPFEEWSTPERDAMRLVRGRVLDVGAGGGRVSLYLQEKGFEVVAIDISAMAVEVCQWRGVKDARHLSFHDVDATLGTFDTIVMFGNNMALLASPSRARTMLKRLHRMTSPKARILGQTMDPYDTENPDHLAYHERNRERGRHGGRVRIRVRFRGQKTPWFDYWFMSRDEVREVVEGTRWRLAKTIPETGPQYIAVLEKD
jgi:SAM-dependent methyltransferase